VFVVDSNLNLTITGDISRLHVEPDDVVLFKLLSPTPISNEQLERVNQHIRTRLSGVEWIDRILVIDGAQVEVSVVGKAGS
jgi:hypothetical protein